MKLVNERFVSLAEVKDILRKRDKECKAEGKELLYEQKKALEHADSSVKLSLKDTKELVEKILALNLGLTDDKAVAIADLMPENVDDVRAIFSKERFKHDEEEIKKIIEVVAQYR